MNAQPLKVPAAPPMPLSGTPQQIMEVVNQLIELLEEETPLIQKRQFQKHDSLLKRKQVLATDYQALLNALVENQSAMKALDSSARNQLHKAGEKLETLARQNAESLRIAHSSTERLLRSVMEEVRRNIQKGSTYCGNGGLMAAQAAKSRPVAYNQRV